MFAAGLHNYCAKLNYPILLQSWEREEGGRWSARCASASSHRLLSSTTCAQPCPSSTPSHSAFHVSSVKPGGAGPKDGEGCCRGSFPLPSSSNSGCAAAASPSSSAGGIGGGATVTSASSGNLVNKIEMWALMPACSSVPPKVKMTEPKAGSPFSPALALPTSKNCLACNGVAFALRWQ